MPRISVVVATYQGSRFLESQLRSIFDQTRPPDEVIVSDDGSTDGTVALAERELRSSRIVHTVTANPGDRGVVANFAHGIGLAHGDLVATSDQDDVWRPDKLATMTTRMEKHPDLLLLHTDARLIGAAGEPLGETLFASVGVSKRELELIRGGRAVEALMRRNLVTGATLMLRRELLSLALPVPSGWLHDEWFGMIAAATGGLGVIDEPLIDYRQHGANQVGARRLDLRGRLSRLTTPRTDRNLRLLTRARVLPPRLAELGDQVASATLDLAEGKVRHEELRSALPSRRLRRVPEVIELLRSGGYARFGNGSADALRDLVQPT